ncbi:MAG: Mut7-C RNAse domain-containing protein [Verrucomicrobiota bacterium]
MSRIRRGYEDRFRALLRRARARRLEPGVQWLVAKAQRLSARERISLADALAQVYEHLATRKPFQPSASQPAPNLFLCDAGLGGLARWLRAAGYEAAWQPDIADDELLRQARVIPATVLTTDGMLMERRLLRDRIIPAFWLPPTLSIPEQLALVFREFGLTLRGPRCMSCGGELRRVSKEALRERIPPRTYRWLDEFFACRRCDKLFWHGTHWHRIVETLAALNRDRSRGASGV